jgi:hypothetical protein
LSPRRDHPGRGNGEGSLLPTILNRSDQQGAVGDGELAWCFQYLFAGSLLSKNENGRLYESPVAVKRIK